MANLYDYLYWRGDIDFTERPFNDVDNIVLATMSYLDFAGIVPAEGEDGSISVRDACKALLDERGGDITERVRSLITIDARLPELLAASERFGSARLSAYVDIVDRSRSLQFSAIQVDLPNQETCIVYRGTDQTLVGWREDFMLGFTVTDAQREALGYLERAMGRIDGGRCVRLLGHSKGGNLAEYAATQCSQEMRDRIVMVYSDDGPRMCPDVIDIDTRVLLGTRLRSIVPAFSVVGMLFAREDSPRTIVESPLVGIAQHDLTSWQVLPDSMQEVEDFEPECKVYNETFRQWTTDVEPDSLRIMTNEVFDALAAGGARTFDEISASPESLQRVLKALGTFDEATRTFGLALLENTLTTSVAIVRKTIGDIIEEWRKNMQEAGRSMQEAAGDAARKLFGSADEQQGAQKELPAGEGEQLQS